RSLDGGGNLRIATPLGVLVDAMPRSYQETAGKTVPVESRFVLGRGANGESTYGFVVGEGYDPRHALIIDPEHPVVLNQLGMLLRRQGKFVEAEAAYLKAVTASPDYALAHYNLGVLNELYFQRLDAALQHFERYQEIEGEDKQVTKWIADLKRRLSAQQKTANVTE
ncbi:MAG: tetratricopeptide repeat protein, partial [Woeseiaceae bacterium]